MADSNDSDNPVPAREALALLMAGNERFLAGTARFPTIQKELLASLAREQRPFATILGCSDSRVPPELLFDANFGELFIIRVAGNVLTPEIAGTLQYAGIHLKTHLFVVLGHEGCGAIKAAVDLKFRNSRVESRIELLLQSILPCLDGIDPLADPKVQVAQAVEANVRWTIQRIVDSPEVRERAAEMEYKLVGAICDIETGRVRFLTGGVQP
jgi:carbonic anhydrase